MHLNFLIILPLVYILYKCSLEQLLSDMVEVDFFITIPENCLRHILRDLLGETPDLHDSIIHSVMQVSKIPTGLTC